jgi:hypothetical protein
MWKEIEISPSIKKEIIMQIKNNTGSVNVLFSEGNKLVEKEWITVEDNDRNINTVMNYGFEVKEEVKTSEVKTEGGYVAPEVKVIGITETKK